MTMRILDTVEVGDKWRIVYIHLLAGQAVAGFWQEYNIKLMARIQIVACLLNVLTDRSTNRKNVKSIQYTIACTSMHNQTQ
jgi:hypothetical protein